MNSRSRFNYLSLTLLSFASYISLGEKSFYGITDILWLVVFSLYGATVSNLIRSKLSIAERVCFGVGLTISSLLFMGLLVNEAGLLLHKGTLLPKYLVPSFDFIFVFALALLSRSNRDFLKKKTNFRKLFKGRWVGLFPIFFPLISLLGVIQLNNNGSNFFAVLSLIFIVGYEFFYFFHHRKSSELTDIINIVCVSAALLLSYSMRSNHILGYDINQEYEVFSAVLKHHVWQPHLINSTYNACLSITVLPTVIKSFVQLSPEYVFKFSMQLILCFVPLTVYVIARHQLKLRRSAFLASIFFIIQAQFILQFPAVIRQQSAMLFFGLVFVSATSYISIQVKRSLVLLFGLAMVVSHYSTAYVCLAFILLVALLQSLWPILTKHKIVKSHQKSGLNLNISKTMVVILLLFSFCWYGQTLESTGGVVQKLSQSVTHLSSFFSSDSRSSFIAQDLNIGSASYNQQTINKIETKDQSSNGYKRNQYSSDKVYPTSAESPNINNVFQKIANDFISSLMPIIIKLVLGVGALIIISRSLRGKISQEEGIIVFSAGALFALLILLPSLSLDYNLTRLYQQLLVVLAPCFVIGIEYIAIQFKRSEAFLGAGFIIAMLYFVSTSNLADQTLFGFSNVNLMNNGTDYVQYYVTNGEYDSLKWLNSNYSRNQTVNIDLFGTLRTFSYTDNIPRAAIRRSLLPSAIAKNGYVFATNSNVNMNLVFEDYNNQVIAYTFPAKFLLNQKSVIYDDNNSKVYK
jgi:uncharacterized membrane protein